MRNVIVLALAVLALLAVNVAAAPAAVAPNGVAPANNICQDRPAAKNLRAPLALLGARAARPHCGGGGALPCNRWVPVGNGWWMFIPC